MTETRDPLQCVRCGRRQLYTRADGSRRCGSCGFIEIKEVIK